jgi:hypothetical protein
MFHCYLRGAGWIQEGADHGRRARGPGRRRNCGKTGGRKPGLSDGHVKHARQLYVDGEHTLAEIAGLLAVSCQTVDRALEPKAVPNPAPG